jgi:hypothetical protein
MRRMSEWHEYLLEMGSGELLVWVLCAERLLCRSAARGAERQERRYHAGAMVTRRNSFWCTSAVSLCGVPERLRIPGELLVWALCVAQHPVSGPNGSCAALRRVEHGGLPSRAGRGAPRRRFQRRAYGTRRKQGASGAERMEPGDKRR